MPRISNFFPPNPLILLTLSSRIPKAIIRMFSASIKIPSSTRAPGRRHNGWTNKLICWGNLTPKFPNICQIFELRTNIACTTGDKYNFHVNLKDFPCYSENGSTSIFSFILTSWKRMAKKRRRSQSSVRVQMYTWVQKNAAKFATWRLGVREEVVYRDSH